MDGKWVIYVFEYVSDGDPRDIGLCICILPPQHEIEYFFLDSYGPCRFFNKRFTNRFLYDLLNLDSMKTDTMDINDDFRKFRSWEVDTIKMAPIINDIGEDIKAVGKYLEGVLEVKVIRAFEIPV